MNASLNQQFNQLETERKNLFNELKYYTDETLNKKPSPEAWSAAEVVAHLVAAEELSLKYLQKKTLDTSREQSEGFKNKWRWLLVKIVFAVPLKFKAPEAVEPKIGYQSLNDLEAQWTNIRSQTLELLQRLTDKELNKTLWKHASAGKLNLHHMIQFFGIHFRRHKKQIERTLEAVK